MHRSRLKHAVRACALGLSFLIPSAGLVAGSATDLAFASGGEVPTMGLIAPGSDRRFTYGDFGESRGQKALRTFKLTMGGIPGEVGEILTFPFREPKTTALFLLGTAALIAVDRQTTAFWQDSVEPIFDGFRPKPLIKGLPFLTTEGQYLVAGIGLTYAGGLAFNDERAQTAALLSTKALTYSYLTSQLILKPIFGRLRPVNNLSGFTGNPGDFTTDPWQFGNSDGIPWTSEAYATSMPSFHFTGYFAIARVYAGVYDNATLPYLAAGVISVANIRGHHHWVSDMVAGAVIGTAIGNLVLNNYEDRKNSRSNGIIMPIVSSQGIGLSFTVEF